ncbi:hypothetical protein [Sinomonas soli]
MTQLPDPRAERPFDFAAHVSASAANAPVGIDDHLAELRRRVAAAQLTEGVAL